MDQPINTRRFEGARLQEAAFPDDAGEPPAEVAAALATYAAPSPAGRPRDRAPVLAALQSSRLLVPVVALLGEVEYDEQGLAHDKSSDMAAVLLTGTDGRTALLAFTGTESLRSWNPEARPVAVPTRVAAQAAVQDGAAALLVDVAGPVPFVVEGDDLAALAAGWTLARVGEHSAWLKQTAPRTDWAFRAPPGNLVRDRSAPPCPHDEADPTSGGSGFPPASTATRSSGPVPGPMAAVYAVDVTVCGGASVHLETGFRLPSGSLFSSSGGHISTELRINDRIRVPEVRLVGPNGETVGIVPTDQALQAGPGGRPRPGRDRPSGQAPRLQAHGLREVQVRERPEGP